MTENRSFSTHRIERSNEHGPFVADVVSELQHVRGVELPADYLSFLRAHNGGQPAPDFFWVVADDWGSGVYELFGAQRTAIHASILQNVDWHDIPLKPGMLAIGSDGVFGYILMSTLSADFGSIHFCCAWSHHPNGYEGQGYWRIADSFSDLLDHLEKSPDEQE
ncbi:MAG: SMI1/KNR4 family protein [Thermoflexales bacterium]